MITNSRENEEILVKLERVRDVCLNTQDKIVTILNKHFTDMELELPKQDIIEDLNYISHNLSTTMKYCDPIFKHYIVLPSSTTEENLPHLLMSMKNDSLAKYEQNLLGKTEYNYDDDNAMDIDIEKENENKVRSNISKVSKNLGDKLREYMKKSKLNYNETDYARDNKKQEINGEDILDNVKKYLNKK